MWGFAPLYFYAVAEVPPIEIVMHRVIWSFGLMLVVVWFAGQAGRLRLLLQQPRKLGLLALTALLIGGNWLIFIWAVTNERLLEASLGYYINPLFNVALGLWFFGERPTRLQALAVALAACGVLIQLIKYGSVPWVALGLAGTFCVYGLLRKRVNLESASGLLVETGLLLPVALMSWLLLDTPTSDLLSNSTRLNALILSAGVVTTLPLLAFSYAVVRIPFFLLGMLQYIGPSLMFVLALTVIGETLERQQLITFAFVWTALLMMSIEGYRNAQRLRRNLQIESV